MTDLNVLQTLFVGHVWQSVALAALLAGVLIFGRRMPGATRYGLASIAFVAAIALPLAAFIPGESLIRGLLVQMDAPKAVEPAPAEEITPPSGDAVAALIGDYAANALATVTNNGTIPLAETDIGKTIIAEGDIPAAWVNFGGNLIQSAIKPAVAPPAPPAEPAPPAAPMFTMPEIVLPAFDIPDLMLPLLLVWLAGTLFLLVRTGRDLIAVEKLVARARPIDLPEALKRRMNGIRVAVSAEAPGPMAAGFFRPCIVLPESIALGSPGMAALLEHERAHIERADMAVALLQRIVLALLWWSPALHFISKRIDEEREVACDECAVQRTGDAKAFARSLTKQAENQLWARAPRLAVGAIGPRSQVGRRIKRLIEIAKGAAPAKYAGRLAFAGLALAVAIAAMVTPRFTAEAQQAPTPFTDLDDTDDLDGGPLEQSWQRDRDLTDEQRRELTQSLQSLDGLDGDFATLGEELESLMEGLGEDLEIVFADLSPELEGELAGLSAEMASLGAEISALVGQELAHEMPLIMAQVRQQLAEEGIEINDWDDFKDLTGFDHEQLREALQEARDEIRQELGPEMRKEIQQAVEEARKELASKRDEIRQAVQQSRAGMDAAKTALAQARVEMDAARKRGDFDRLNGYKYNFNPNFDFDFDFDFDPETMRKLRDMNIDLDGARVIRAKSGGTPNERLMRAARRGDEDQVRNLIVNEKADVNALFPGDGTPLIEAVRSGDEDVVRALINAGADVNRASRGDGNPLIVAVSQGEEDIARLLIESGANVNAYVQDDETPLINAAAEGCIDMVKLLVEHGARVNTAYNVDSWGPGSGGDGRGRTELRSPLNQAEKYGRDEVVSYLRSKGAVAQPRAAN
jgi:beta-lactamase regulating signal transducer with metallopeptidase domain